MTANCEGKMKLPFESTHRITFSLDGVEPVYVTLPNPVLLPSSTTLNAIALPRKGGVIEIIFHRRTSSTTDCTGMSRNSCNVFHGMCGTMWEH